MSSPPRDEVLGRVRRALTAAPPLRSAALRHDVDPPTPGTDAVRAVPTPAGFEQPADMFAARAADYRASVARIDGASVAAAVGAACERHGVRTLLLAPGVADCWVPGSVPGTRDDGSLDAAALDAVDGVLTGCALAIAQTGTIVLDGRPLSGRRAITLVPDLHICVVDGRDIVATVADAFKRIAPAIAEGRPVTFVSGPSATSDIELERVEGVHGPRRLEIILIDRDQRSS